MKVLFDFKKVNMNFCINHGILILVSIYSVHGRPREEENIDRTNPDQVQFEVQSNQDKQGTKQEEDVMLKFEDKIAAIKTPVNVHDALARQIADKMKQKFVAGDPEEMMHGGHHAHSDDGPKQQIGVGGDNFFEFMAPEDKNEKEEEKTGPSTLDTEELMHQGDGGHGHNPHGDADAHKEEEKGPTAANPEDLLHVRDEEDYKERLKNKAAGADNPEEQAHARDYHGPENQQSAGSNTDGQKIGVDVEEVVHGDGHAHDPEEVTEEYEDDDGITKTRKLGKEITFEDIQALGLSKDQLDGVDLKRLLRRDKSEYNAWKKEKKKEVTDQSFWEKVESFRTNYLDMLSNSIRHLSRYDSDDDDPEWENDLFDDEPHPGESRVDHESELWGSTRNKANRKRRTFTVLHRPTHEGTEEL